MQGKRAVDQLRILNEFAGGALNLTDFELDNLKYGAQKPYNFAGLYGATENIIAFPEEVLTDTLVMLLFLEIIRFLLRKGSESKNFWFALT